MPDEVVAPVRRSAWWRRVSGRMDKASIAMRADMQGLAAPGRKLDDAFYDELTEVLIAADCGVELAERLATALRHRARREKLVDGAAAISALKAEILAVMSTYDRSLNLSAVPSVVLVVGVNGSGKTTTIGKLAYRLQEEGRSSLIAAAD
ncbi:MAG TPA: signal recognition particle receptor subunit alpha, partial [Solirubrobacteraceae bacterium]